MDVRKPVLWIVIPCFNEEEVLPLMAPVFLDKLTQLIDRGKISDLSRICLVDDRSDDGTWDIINRLAGGNFRFGGVSLSRNRGHQNALLCGLMDSMGVESVFNHADYRLLSVEVLDHLSEYGEVNLFLRGMVPLVGFRSCIVEYEREERIAGGKAIIPFPRCSI